MGLGETPSTRMKSVLLKFVVGGAALCGLAALLLVACALVGIGPEMLAAFDPLSAVSLLLVAVGALLARWCKIRRAGQLLTALGGLIGAGALLTPNAMS